MSKTLWGQRSNLFNIALPTGAPEIYGKIHPTRSYELDEQTRDADLDAVMHFKPSKSGLTLSSTEACLKGKYTAPDGNSHPKVQAMRAEPAFGFLVVTLG